MKKYSVIVTIIALAELVYILSGSVGAPRPESIAAQSRAAVAAYQPAATMIPISTKRPSATAKPRPTATPQPRKTYILNTNTKKFHLPSCSSVKQMYSSNKREYTGTRQEVINMGYKPCQKCKP